MASTNDLFSLLNSLSIIILITLWIIWSVKCQEMVKHFPTVQSRWSFDIVCCVQQKVQNYLLYVAFCLLFMLPDPHFYCITKIIKQRSLHFHLPFTYLFLTLFLLFIFSCSALSVCIDGSSLAVREEVKMENGRSPVLGSSLSESEGTELMEGAAAAVGRQQASPPLLPHLSPHIWAPDRFYFFSSGSLDFQMSGEAACQQDHTQKSSQAPPTKKSTVYLSDGAESSLSRPPTLHKQPPALPPKPFNRLPNHITGKLARS